MQSANEDNFIIVLQLVIELIAKFPVNIVDQYQYSRSAVIT